MIALPAAARGANDARPKLAVILAAGCGSRMADRPSVPKPLISILGMRLVERTILALAAAGVERFRVVVGARGDEVMAGIRTLPRLKPIRIEFVHAADHALGNGHSFAAGAARIDEPFYLAMSDHVFDPAIARRLADQAACDPERIHLATDGNVAGVYDLDDATKVRASADGSIQAIGKQLESYDRVDTGIFLCPAWVSRAATDAVAAGAHSVSAVMESAIARGDMRSCPVEPLFWQDVDTPDMLQAAERRLLNSARKSTDGPVSRYFNRTISIATTRVLSRLQATPNQVSTFVFALGIAAAILAASQTWWHLALAAVLTQMASVWDGTDGELARATLRGTKFGAWYDTITDNLRYAGLVVGSAVGLYLRAHDGVWLILAAVFLLGLTYMVVRMSLHLVRTGGPGTFLAVRAKVEARTPKAEAWYRWGTKLSVMSKQDVLAAGAAVALLLDLRELIVLAAVSFVVIAGAVVLRTLASLAPKPGVGLLARIRPLFVLVGVAVLVLVVARAPLGEIASVTGAMGWGILFAGVVALGWYALNAAGLQALMDWKVPFHVLFLNRLMGEAYNTLIPAANLGGEPIKLDHLSRHVPAARALSALIGDRLVTMTSALLFSALTLCAGAARYEWPDAVESGIYAFTAVAAVASLALMLTATSRLPASVARLVMRMVGRRSEPSHRVGTGQLLLALLFSLAGRAVSLAETAVILALLRVPCDFAAVVALTGLVSAGSTLGFVVPGSLGVAEAAAIWGFGLLGWPASLAVAFGLARRGRILAYGAIGVGVSIWFGHSAGRSPGPAMAEVPAITGH